MTQYKEEFLSLIRTALGATRNSPVACDEINWEKLFSLAEQHHVLPIVVDAAHRVYGNDMKWEQLMPYKKRAQRLIYLQAIKTERFISLYKYLSERRLTPLVMKGLICRELYPNPDFRFSADEDLLIQPDEAPAYHEALLAYGLKTDASEEETTSSQETPYKSDDGVLFLEVHRFPFPPDSGAYGEYNLFFEDAFRRAVTVTYAGIDVQTMAPTDHLFYLICHAIKHFLHGGCGIRQLCDISLFAREYGEQIEWTRLMEQIDSIHARDFTTSFFAIAEEFLGIDMTGVPDRLRISEIDPEEMLDDILESGVYGSSSMSRKHSANITLGAAETTGSGTPDKKHTWIRTLFPSVSSLKNRYPYLIKRPWLLPAAWLQRIFHYLGEWNPTNSPGEALRLGRERVSLMKQYGLLSDQPVKPVATGPYLAAPCDLIDQGHEVSIPVAGSSMTPFLGDGRDQVFVKAPWRPIRRGDIVLYRRRNGDFVLHRVYRVHGSNDKAVYDMVGDAQDRIEGGIQRKQIYAMATRARRKGKIIEPGCFYWWIFQHLWIRMIPLRRYLMRLYAVIYKIKQV